jgi:hypothetical protein
LRAERAREKHNRARDRMTAAQVHSANPSYALLFVLLLFVCLLMLLLRCVRSVHVRNTTGQGIA